MGCFSVHIGGGEPFLDKEGLKTVLATFTRENMDLDYVETNCAWYKDHESAVELLNEMRDEGLTTILVSISPFHNEHVPFSKTRGVMEAAREAHVGVFPWVESFVPQMEEFEERKTHTLEEYEQQFGKGYIKDIPNNYWVTFRGRALETYEPYMKAKKVEKIVRNNRGACKELFDTSHFHLDLYENYVPGLCTGLALDFRDVGSPVDSEKYPFLHALMSGGIGALLSLVKERYGFTPREQYVSKCQLCYHIRHFLVEEKDIDSPDLQPVQYYTLE
jgi:hypothetical protein